MAQASPKSTHKWSFYRAGGVDQVRLDKGADILNLDQLDQKLWVALSCPVKGLEIDTRTLELLDSDKDSHVRPPEVIATVRWLRDALQNADSLAKGEDGVQLANLRQDTAEGKALLASCKHILKSLGKDSATVITVADSTATADVFAKAKRNGDGIVPPESIDDADARKVAEELVANLGGGADRSGKPGLDQARLDEFFAACADFDAWHKLAEADAKNVLPFGDGTAAAYAAFTAVRAKVDDYFGRCRLAAFDPRALAAVNREEAAYMAAAAKDLSITASEVAHFPLAIVEANKPLSLTKGVNPAWAAALGALQATCCKGKDTLTEADWAALGAKFDGYAAWLGKRGGAKVEPLGVQRVRTILAGKTKAALQKAIDDDLAVAGEVEAMTRVEKLCRLHRDFARLLNNYVSFTDFYARRGAIFQAGTLFLDGRSLDLCFHVNDAGKHGTLAPMAKTYLAYVDCTRPGAPKMQVACAFTAGDSDNLFVGRNGVFYDRKGQDWDATITKIVDNPISIGQAFWSPYKKLIRWIEETVAKRAAEADTAASAKLQDAATKTGEAAATGKAADAAPKKMDIGVLAAISVAISGITAIVGKVLESFFGLGYLMPLGLVGLVLLISGPSMLIAFMKLRQRNLGPILDANGWAVNTLTKVNIPLGGSLTELPKLPAGSERSLVDPYAPKKSIWPKLLLWLLILAGIGFGLYWTNLLHKWLPAYIPAHHTELDLGADKTSGAPGAVVALTVRSAATSLAVTDATDSNKPVPLAAIPIEAGKPVSWTIPEGSKPGTVFVVSDAVSSTSVKIAVVEK
jgi:hypothetical protein